MAQNLDSFLKQAETKSSTDSWLSYFGPTNDAGSWDDHVPIDGQGDQGGGEEGLYAMTG